MQEFLLLPMTKRVIFTTLVHCHIVSRYSSLHTRLHNRNSRLISRRIDCVQLQPSLI